MAQEDNLGLQPRLRPERRRQYMQQQAEKRIHPADTNRSASPHREDSVFGSDRPAKSPRPFPGTPHLAFCCETATARMVRPSAIVFGRWRSSRSSLRRDRPGRTLFERIIGSIRREYLDHVIVFDERHLRHVLSAYFQYHHQSRTHLSLDLDCPEPRTIQPPSAGTVVAFPQVGGLHHRYERRAA